MLFCYVDMELDPLPHADPIVVEHNNFTRWGSLPAFVSVMMLQQRVIRQEHHTGCNELRNLLLHRLLVFVLLLEMAHQVITPALLLCQSCIQCHVTCIQLKRLCLYLLDLYRDG